MALPLINTPEYELTVPSTKKTIPYRPYLIKEEKILMLALESKDNNQMVNAVKRVVNQCTFDSVDVGKLPMFDLEYIFLKIRGKSVGEVSTVGVSCPHCKVKNNIDIELDEAEIVGEIKPQNKVMLTEDVGMILRYPCIDDVQKNLKVSKDTSQFGIGITALISAIETIFDKDNTYPADSVTNEELVEYVENFNSTQMKKVKEVLEKTPKLKITTKYKCLNCKEDNELTLEGLNNFFV